ncbi:hypothetical protein EJB05_04849, partial [Eragrostis curvula]
MAKRRRQTKTGGGSRRHITKQQQQQQTKWRRTSSCGCRSSPWPLPAACRRPGTASSPRPPSLAATARPPRRAQAPPLGSCPGRAHPPPRRLARRHGAPSVAVRGLPARVLRRRRRVRRPHPRRPVLQGRILRVQPVHRRELRLPPRLQPWYFHGAGLGYDGGEDRHKAVLLELGAAGHVPRLQCSVVTVGGPWSWRAPRGQRTMPIISDDAIVAACTDPVFADGRLHWMLLNGARGHLDGVLSFELGSEAFRRLPLPPPFADENLPGSDRETMAELDGRLCLVRDLSYPRRDVAVFEVWMLRDYNHPLSWSLDRRIDLTPHIGKQLTRLWEGEFFVVCYTGGQSSGESRKIVLATTGFAQRAYVYEPDTGELRTLVCWVDYGVQPQLRLVLHQGSLLQVDGMEYHNKDIKFTFTDERRISAPRYVSLFDY